MSTTNAGGRAAPRAYTITVYRDARGRFTSKPPSEQELLREFDEKGSCSFPDPWRPRGKYVIETRRSLKGFPVGMRYEGAVHKDYAYSGVIKYGLSAKNWGDQIPEGEVAISPMPWMGDPRSGWGDGQWGQFDERTTNTTTKRQLAALYIHLAHSVDLHTKNCGNRIGVLKNY